MILNTDFRAAETYAVLSVSTGAWHETDKNKRITMERLCTADYDYMHDTVGRDACMGPVIFKMGRWSHKTWDLESLQKKNILSSQTVS